MLISKNVMGFIPNILLSIIFLIINIIISNAQTMATNPIINADVPDAAIVRVGNTYYMSSTTMHMNPGVPIMKSTDLVNWELVSYCYSTLSTSDAYSLTNGRNEYGHGSWASSIRYHKGMYYVTTFANTGRTYIYKTANIETGPWTLSTLNASYHDCNLFFDDDDRAYLIYGQGDIKIIELTADASAIKAGGTNKTLITNAGAIAGPIGLNAEGSQVLKYNGYYYINTICWPSGGMRTQLVHRSSTLTGTYESKVILKDQGVAQGSFIQTPFGKWYAYLFRDSGAVGRIPYLVPMTWANNWPVLSAVPVTLDIPKGTGGMHNIVASDDFSQAPPLKLAWQWNHNPQNNYWSLTQKSGYLRLTNERTDPNALMTTNTLTQRTFGPQCSAYTSIDVTGMKDGDYVGMIALQKQYGYVGVKMTGGTKSIVMVNGNDVTGTPNQVASIPLNQNVVYVRIDMDYRNRTDKAYFYYSLNGTTWQTIGTTLQMSYTIPHFMGYRYGLFSYATTSTGGYADFDFFRIGANITEASTIIDNSASINITAPANNTVYTEGDNVTLNATATIATGSISKVDFYNGTTLLGTDATSPYTYTWNAVAAGNYAITAKATSAANAATTSTAINIQIAKPIYQTGSAPTIDGTIDALWSNFTSVAVSKTVNGTVSSTTDLSGNWKAMWNATNLYVLVQVTDDVKRNDAGTDVYNDDGVEVYIDMGNTKAATYGSNDHQYTFRWNDATAAYEINGHSVAGITKGITNTATGYIVEVSIPWSTMGGSVTANSLQGFEVMINDDDDGGAREGKLAWSATTDETWSNPSLMGTVILKGLNCTAPTATITTTTSTTFCAGGSVTLNAPAGTGYSYVWKNGTTTLAGATASAYAASTAGSYTVTVTNAGGCSATSSATAVTVNALPAAAITTTTPTTFCAGGNVTLNANTGIGLTYQWYNGTNATGTGASSLALYVSSGSFTVKVTDANGCSSTSAPVVVTTHALPNAPTVTTPTVYCQNAAAIQLSATGSNLKWYTQATGGIALAAVPTPATSNTGTINYYVSQTTGCESARAMIAVTVNAAPLAPRVTETASYCQNAAAIQLSATGSNLKWYTQATGGAGVTAAPTPATSNTGTTNYYVSQTTECESARAMIAVTVNAAPLAPRVTETASYCQNAAAIQLSATGSNLKWYTQTTGGIALAAASTPATSNTGTTNYYVSQTTEFESARSMIAVTVNAAPLAPTVTSTASYCQNAAAIQLSATGSNLKWYTQATGGAGVTAAPTPATSNTGTTNYYVSQTTGCESARSMIAVTVNAKPVATITASGSTTIPQGGSVDLIASAGVSYKWFNGSSQVGSLQTCTATEPGVYTVEVTNANNCFATSSGTNVNLNSNQPSLIVITSPTKGSSVQGPITITATASDPDGTIVKVEYLIDDILVETRTSAPYSFLWNNPSPGDHVITIRVTDSNGGITTSEAVPVNSEATTTGLHSNTSNTLHGTIYPNPSNGMVFIDSDADLSVASFMLIDVLGNEHNVSKAITGLGAQIDVSNLSAGTYVLIINKEGSVMRKKITVMK